MFKLLALTSLAAAATATTYLKDDFSDANYAKRWTQSTAKGDEAGTVKLAAGKWYDKESNKGLQTAADAKFYQLVTPFSPAPFSNKDKNLVVQFSVKHEQGIDCGGGYVKLLKQGYDAKTFDGESAYNIMFGPDICGATKRTHLIFNYKGENHLIKNEIPCESDDTSHLYQLVVRPDNTYTVSIDGEEKRSGSLKEDWDMLPPKEVDDPAQSKPADWVDVQKIDDPEDVKPADWDDIPEKIEDPDAVQPDDWDVEMDGEWERPMIANPAYKGAWKAKQIDNPAYKGPWVHPRIANPDYFDDDTLYKYDDFGGLAIEVWQVKSGTIFDNFLVTDDVAAADAAVETFKKSREAELKMKEEIKAAEAKKAEEERAAAEAETEDEEEDEEEEEDKSEL